GPSQKGQDTLAFAERIDPDEMAALREQGERMQELVDLMPVRRMAEDGQPEGCLSDEDVARTGLEGRAGRIRPALVITGNDNPCAAIIEHDLGAAEYMPGRQEPHHHIANRYA